jgi:hypothetical protein
MYYNKGERSVKERIFYWGKMATTSPKVKMTLLWQLGALD